MHRRANQADRRRPGPRPRRGVQELIKAEPPQRAKGAQRVQERQLHKKTVTNVAVTLPQQSGPKKK